MRINRLQGMSKGRKVDLSRRTTQNSLPVLRDRGPYHDRVSISLESYHSGLHVVLAIFVQASHLEDIENVMYV